MKNFKVTNWFTVQVFTLIQAKSEEDARRKTDHMLFEDPDWQIAKTKYNGDFIEEVKT